MKRRLSLRAGFHKTRIKPRFRNFTSKKMVELAERRNEKQDQLLKNSTLPTRFFRSTHVSRGDAFFWANKPAKEIRGIRFTIGDTFPITRALQYS